MHHTTKSHTPHDSHYTTTLYTTPHAPHTTHQSLLNSKHHFQITISLSPSPTTYHHHHLTVSPSEEAHNRGCTVIVVISEAEIMFERPAWTTIVKRALWTTIVGDYRGRPLQTTSADGQCVNDCWGTTLVNNFFLWNEHWTIIVDDCCGTTNVNDHSERPVWTNTVDCLITTTIEKKKIVMSCA